MLKLNIATSILSWLVLTMGSSIILMRNENDNNNDNDRTSYNILSLSLLFFNYLNLLISFCEICLGRYISLIQLDYRALKELYKGKELDACVAFLTMPLTFRELFDGKIWSKMWSTYSLYDPSYQNPESFGFFIDVGNGWTTILPISLINVAIVRPEILARLLSLSSFTNNTQPHIVVGCLGIASYWQMMYGTFIYFLSYFFNNRHRGKSFWEVAGFVGVSNAVWVIFPAIGLFLCYHILSDGNMSVLR